MEETIFEALQQGDLAAVDAQLDSFLVQGTPDVQYAFAEGCVQLGFIAQADRVFEHLQYLFPEEAQLKIDRAQVQMELGDEDSALELLMDVRDDEPEYPQALLVLADFYQMQGLYEVAEQRLNDALELLPEEPLLHFAKAELLVEIGRFTEAARLYEELYAQQHDFAGVNLAARLAEVYRAGAAYETALDYYMKALEDDVTADLLFGSAYAAFQVEKYDTAILQLEDLKELDPDYFSAYLLLAQSYGMQEQNDKAYTAILEGIARDEYDKSLFLYAGKMALKNSLPQKAEEHLQQALALDPEYMEAALVLMSLYAQQERDEEVIALYEDLNRNDFDWTALYPFVAKAHVNLEQYKEAAAYYDEAYRDHAEDASFLEEYAYFLLEEGRRDDAKRVVAELIALDPSEDRYNDLQLSLD
ncbi:tetratricopeptide repeat protein [Caryophanon latum]|uniref:Uncharacterized protein n=1 Tax=Caryophanon latum TaxID=33977 RepID=A0A1C0YQU3_9BACL|nr:tetratricopeptide repeat protein [Caryophanon latum]OCS89459.1 hypothetical protein A6K76_12455 [Caryophanon latum]